MKQLTNRAVYHHGSTIPRHRPQNDQLEQHPLCSASHDLNTSSLTSHAPIPLTTIGIPGANDLIQPMSFQVRFGSCRLNIRFQQTITLTEIKLKDSWWQGGCQTKATMSARASQSYSLEIAACLRGQHECFCSAGAQLTRIDATCTYNRGIYSQPYRLYPKRYSVRYLPFRLLPKFSY